MNDKIAFQTKEFEIEENAVHHLESIQNEILNDCNALDVPPEYLELFKAIALKKQSLQKIFGTGYQLFKSYYGLWVLMNPNIVTAEYRKEIGEITKDEYQTAAYLEKVLTFDEVKNAVHWVQNDLCEKGIIVDLFAAPIIRTDSAFDIELPRTYNEYINVLDLATPQNTPREIQKARKEWVNTTIYLQNSKKSRTATAYDKQAKINKDLKGYYCEKSLMRFEYRSGSIPKPKRTTLNDLDESKYLNRRADDKLVLEKTFFNRKGLKSLTNNLAVLDELKIAINTGNDFNGNLINLLCRMLAPLATDLGMPLQKYLGISSTDTKAYQRYLRISKGIKSALPIESNLIEIYNELHELFKKAA